MALYWQRTGRLGAVGLHPYLRKELLEKGGLVLFDGLDEVPEAEQRRVQIKQMVESFSSGFPRCRVLVTSRTYAYQKQEWRLARFSETVLAPFSRAQIEQFINRWYAQIALLRKLNADDVQGRAALLKRAVFNSDRLLGLAERPLLLTLMASLHAWRGGSLPDKREELYSDAVELLLDWWESQRVVRGPKGEIILAQPGLVEVMKIKDRGALLLPQLEQPEPLQRRYRFSGSGSPTADLTPCPPSRSHKSCQAHVLVSGKGVAEEADRGYLMRKE